MYSVHYRTTFGKYSYITIRYCLNSLCKLNSIEIISIFTSWIIGEKIFDETHLGVERARSSDLSLEDWLVYHRSVSILIELSIQLLL